MVARYTAAQHPRLARRLVNASAALISIGIITGVICIIAGGVMTFVVFTDSEHSVHHVSGGDYNTNEEEEVVVEI